MPSRLSSLPPLNAIANKVLALAGDPDIDLTQIAVVMEGDPAFAADVLFLANSALFGFRSRIQGVRHAISVLGLERVKALAVTVAMRGFLGKGGPLLAQCWQHSAACAIIAEEIAPVFDVKSDVAYTLGLLHDIGRLGLLKSYPAEYSPLFSCTFHSVEEVLCVERTLLNFDHAHAGAWMVKAWNYPPIFEETCQEHHDAISPRDSGMLQTIKVACQMAEAVGYAAVTYANAIAYEDVIRDLPPHLVHKRFPSEAGLAAKVELRLKEFDRGAPSSAGRSAMRAR